jgi:hypothetical protein
VTLQANRVLVVLFLLFYVLWKQLCTQPTKDLQKKPRTKNTPFKEDSWLLYWTIAWSLGKRCCSHNSRASYPELTQFKNIHWYIYGPPAIAIYYKPLTSKVLNALANRRLELTVHLETSIWYEYCTVHLFDRTMTYVCIVILQSYLKTTQVSLFQSKKLDLLKFKLAHLHCKFSNRSFELENWSSENCGEPLCIWMLSRRWRVMIHQPIILTRSSRGDERLWLCLLPRSARGRAEDEWKSYGYGSWPGPWPSLGRLDAERLGSFIIIILFLIILLNAETESITQMISSS